MLPFFCGVMGGRYLQFMKKYFLILLAAVAPYVASSQSEMAHLSTQKVLAAVPSYNSAIQKLEAYRNEVQQEIEVMVADYRKVEDNLIKNQQSWTPIRIQIEQEKLMKKQQAIQEREQSAQMELEAYSNELNQPILEMVEKSVKIVSDRHNYDYVFDESTLIIANGPDITEEVIQEARILDSQLNPPPAELVPSE